MHGKDVCDGASVLIAHAINAAITLGALLDSGTRELVLYLLPALIPQIRDATPSQNTRAEVLDTRSSGSCRGRVVASACLGWSYG
jgi:hypothetical protein